MRSVKLIYIMVIITIIKALILGLNSDTLKSQT